MSLQRLVEWFEASLKTSYELTVGGHLGPWPTDDTEPIVLGRETYFRTSARGRGSERSGDTRCQGTQPPRFRGLAARADFLAADRPDIVYSAKEI